MLSVYKLKIFVTVAQEGSFSQAAKKLYLTQSAISQHINALEGKLGSRLFQRTSRGVDLTPAGKTLEQYARQILWLTEAAESAASDVARLEDGVLNLGATPSASIYLLPDWMHSFHQNYPSINISLETDITANLIKEIKKEKIELGILEGEIVNDGTLGTIPLKDTVLLVIVHPDHPWAELDSISIHQLGEVPFIARRMASQTRNWVDRLLTEYEIEPQIAFEFDDPESIKRAVIRKLGVSIMPTCAVQDELKDKKLISIPLAERVLKRQLKCIWSLERPLSATSRAFLAMLSETYPRLRSLSEAPQPLPAELFTPNLIENESKISL